MKLMKRILLLLVVLSFVASPVFGAEFKLKGASATPEVIAHGKMGRIFSDLVKENSSGRIDVKFYPSAQLGGELEIMNQLKDGIIDFAVTSAAIASNYNPKMDIMYAPFVVPSDEAFAKFTSSAASQELLGSLNHVGILGLEWVPYGFDGLVWKQPIHKLSDVKNRKIRAAESQIIMSVLKSFGADPVPLPFPEVYQSLQTGVVDGLTTPPFVVNLAKLDEVTSGMTLTKHIYGTHIFWFNKGSFNELPQDIQAVVLAAADEATSRTKELNMAERKSARTALESKGYNIIEPTEADFAEFKNATSQALRDFEKRIDDEAGDGRGFMQRMFAGFGRDYDKEIYGQ